jgi:hypothetical protein
MMEVMEDKIIKVEISIPSNENTESLMEDIQGFIADAFGGLTRSLLKPHEVYEGIWIDSSVEPPDIYKEPVVRFIIYIDPKEAPEAIATLEMLAERLIDAGEKETWQISCEAMRYRYQAT